MNTRNFLSAMLGEDLQSRPLASYVSAGGRLHSRADCKASRKAGAPKNCVIHRPSLHRLTGSRQVLRGSGLVEDTCPHIIGHPNPDSVAYLDWATESSWGSHGCDGCCGPIPKGSDRGADPGWPPQDS